MNNNKNDSAEKANNNDGHSDHDHKTNINNDNNNNNNDNDTTASGANDKYNNKQNTITETRKSSKTGKEYKIVQEIDTINASKMTNLDKKREMFLCILSENNAPVSFLGHKYIAYCYCCYSYYFAQ